MDADFEYAIARTALRFKSPLDALRMNWGELKFFAALDTAVSENEKRLLNGAGK
jgi:hypothetical protein